MSGYTAAFVTVLIWASYPVATRAGVTGSFAPHDLMLLRFGGSALLFLPWLMFNFRTINRKTWLQGILLAVFQGVGMAALVICGLQFAPANHAAALGPGVSPAWVALLGFIMLSRRPSSRVIVGALLCATGVLALVWWSTTGLSARVLAGDAMFLAASALGALYVLQLRTWGIGAIQGAAIVSLYSALVVVPWYFYSAPGSLWQITPLDLLWQVLWQGVLIGCVALVTLNHAIERLGSARSSATVALVPVLTAILGFLFLGEVPSTAELLAIFMITAGVSIAASRLPQPSGRPAYSGNPANRNALEKRPACGLSRPG